MKFGLYCVARYKRNEEGVREFVEYGTPFVEFDDTICLRVVRNALFDVKDKLDLSLFGVVKVGEFYPDLEFAPVVGCCDAPYPCEVLKDCSALFDEVKENEQE